MQITRQTAFLSRLSAPLRLALVASSVLLASSCIIVRLDADDWAEIRREWADEHEGRREHRSERVEPEAAPGDASPAPESTPPSTIGSIGLGDSYYPELGNGGYDVLHYDLDLDVDMESGVLEARATITARALHALDRFNLELAGLDIESITVDGDEATFERDGRELSIEPRLRIRAESEFTVEVVYGGVPEPTPDPGVPFVPGVGWFRKPSGVYVVSECTGAASWFPCNDHPLDKATYQIRVTVDKPFVVAANGLLIEEKDHGTARSYTWRASDPMATYLVTVNIAEFDVRVEKGPNGIPMRLYYPVDATDAELAEFARTADIIEFFAERFGPYPFECVGGVISYESMGGALETQTIPVYSRGCDEATVAHELAHQWFGDCVSPETWQDLWLSEGFASYSEFLWFEHVHGEEAAQGRMRGMYGMLREGEVGPPVDPGLETLFGASVYGRGSYALHMLRTEVGDDAFFEILRAWVESNHDAHGTTDEFVALAEDVSNHSLMDLFEGVLFAPVIPRVAAFEAADEHAVEANAND